MLFRNDRTLILYALLLFIFSAIYGLILRWNFAFPSALISYKNLLQGHSHVAFLGWGYLAAIYGVLKLFIPKEKRNLSIYKVTISIIIITITLMLFSFILSGYKVFSIVLLSVFGVATYVLFFRILKDLKGKSTSTIMVKYGIYYYLISSLATWFLAFVIVTQGKTNLYYNSVYFYLHFLYNGFFVFTLFGLLFKILKNQKIIISTLLKKYFFIFLNLACIPAYILSVLWSTTSLTFNVIGFLASFLQLISLLFLFKILKQALVQINWSYTSKLLLKVAIIAYSFKILTQLASSFPYFVEKSLALKPYFIIGYLHLFTLGFMSVLLLLILKQLKTIYSNSVILKVGIGFFLTGITFTELLLFLQGFLLLMNQKLIPNYTIILLIFSFFIVVGIINIFISQFVKPALSNK
ncbi:MULTISPECIES: hypothetical protein [Flavobacteriaceae]|uniref:NnrS family protein n=2 Tax=Flavobacteriaceae TaxID=49546 RepID=A0A4Y8AWG2_9FLAO|nr:MULTISPECIES: hypothetical protein [Flavobacteriaceae]TEW76831.1 hypothetical protein E2488_03005 [Gramella jeungdoensis]GGK49673.1 hypothetical protein GCM10007963_17510 [Lutibacter litoralis]